MSPALSLVVAIGCYCIFLAYLGARPEKPSRGSAAIWHADPVEHKRRYMEALDAYRAKQGLPPHESAPRRFWQVWRKPEDETMWGAQTRR